MSQSIACRFQSFERTCERGRVELLLGFTFIHFLMPVAILRSVNFMENLCMFTKFSLIFYESWLLGESNSYDFEEYNIVKVS